MNAGEWRIRLSVVGKDFEDLNGNVDSKHTASDWSGFDDGEPSALSRMTRFTGHTLPQENRVEAQHVETLIEFTHRQSRIKRTCNAAACMATMRITACWTFGMITP